MPKPANQAKVMMNLSQGGSEESATARGGVQKPSGAAGEDASIAFVEKVRLSQDEENDFERKRDELRTLIRKMWEESKGDS